MKTKVFSVLISVGLLINPVFLADFSVQAQQNTKQAQVQLANRYAQTAHNAYEYKDFLKAAENYEKAYKVSNVKVYLDNALVAYSSLAYDLSEKKDYDKAILYCNKALSLSPTYTNAKDVLAEVHYQRGSDYFYTGQLDKAKIELNESLKYSSSQDQKDRAKDGLSKIDEAGKQGATVVPKYQQSSDPAIPDTIAQMENKVYGAPNNSGSLVSRLSKLEKDTFSKNYDSDGLIIRVDRLKRAILPDQVSPAPSYQSDNSAYDGTYIPEIIQQSMGRISIFGKMPIVVYITDCNVKPFKNFYRDAVMDAFKEWEKASDNRIKFQYEYTPYSPDVDIKVSWLENFEDFAWQPTLTKDDISAEKEKMKYRKANAAVQIGSVAAMLAGSLIGLPFLGGLGAVGGELASPILQYKGNKMDRTFADVKINTKITEGMTDDAAKAKIKQIALHQIGHALGIYGHSSDPKDIMYASFTAMKLSDRDIKTIKEIYKPKEEEKKDKKEKKK